jgi:hypothetical protein
MTKIKRQKFVGKKLQFICSCCRRNLLQPYKEDILNIILFHYFPILPSWIRIKSRDLIEFRIQFGSGSETLSSIPHPLPPHVRKPFYPNIKIHLPDLSITFFSIRVLGRGLPKIADGRGRDGTKSNGGSGALVSSFLRLDVSSVIQYPFSCLSFKPLRNTELLKSSLYIYELQIFQELLVSKFTNQSPHLLISKHPTHLYLLFSTSVDVFAFNFCQS